MHFGGGERAVKDTILHFCERHVEHDMIVNGVMLVRTIRYPCYGWSASPGPCWFFGNEHFCLSW